MFFAMVSVETYLGDINEGNAKAIQIAVIMGKEMRTICMNLRLLWL